MEPAPRPVEASNPPSTTLDVLAPPPSPWGKVLIALGVLLLLGGTTVWAVIALNPAETPSDDIAVARPVAALDTPDSPVATARPQPDAGLPLPPAKPEPADNPEPQQGLQPANDPTPDPPTPVKRPDVTITPRPTSEPKANPTNTARPHEALAFTRDADALDSALRARGVVAPIQFQSGESSAAPINDDDRKVLMGALARCKGEIVLTGHSCDHGTTWANRAVGLARARNLHRLLEQHGLDHALRVETAGADAPVATNDTLQGRRLNRRVVLTCPNDPPVTGTRAP